MILHPLSPVFDAASRVLILGSFPSVKSREICFYYGNPQNKFWKILETLSGECCGATPAEKTAFLHKYRIALWDVIAGCEIVGSSDNKIKNPVAAEIETVLNAAPIEKILLNGKKAYELFLKFFPDVSLPCVCLPSTSPANVSFSLAMWRNELAEFFERGNLR